MPRDITIKFTDGTEAQYKGVPDNVTPEQVMARAKADYGKEIAELDGGKGNVGKEAFKEVGRVVDKTVRGGVTALPGFLGDSALATMRQAADALPGPLGFIMRAFGGNDPDNALQKTKFGDVVKALQTAGGALPELSKPQTEIGKAAGNIGETVVGTMTGGGVGTTGQKALMGLASGSGAEIAARATDDNVVARTLGGLAGGLSAMAGQKYIPNAQSIVRTATEQLTPSDWNRAKVLEATLNEANIPHLKSQLLGPRSTLADTVAVAGTNPQVRPKLISGVEGSATAARNAFERHMLKTLPIDTEGRGKVLNDVQEAAAEAIRGLSKKANEAFEAAMPMPGTVLPQERVQALYTTLKDLADNKYGPTDPAGGNALRSFAELLVKKSAPDLSKVNPVILRRAQAAGKDLATLPGAQVSQEFITDAHHINNLLKNLNKIKLDEKYKSLPTMDLKRVMKEFTPEFDAAREAKRSAMVESVNPAQKGLTGQLAQMGGGVKPDRMTATDTALARVFPVDKAQPAEIIALGKNLGGDAVGQLMRENMARSMERTFILAGTERNVRQPADFVSAIAGTQAQQTNLKAAFKVLAEEQKVNPAALRNGFYKLMRAMWSFDDLKLPSQIDKGSLAQEAGKTLPGFMVAPHSRLGRAFWERATAKTYNQIADIVLSPDGLKQLEAIARSPKPDTARQYAASVLAAAGSGDDKEIDK